MNVSYIILGIIAAIAITCGLSAWSAANYGNRQVNLIKKQHENMQNVLSAYSLKLKEAAQIPDMYKDDLKEVYKAVLEGRYGENGSKAMFQFFQEKNPNFDSSLYTKLQQIIEAGRDEFKVEQTKLLDLKNSFETNLGYVWTGMWMKLAGYSKEDVAEYKIIKSDHATKAFESGVDTEIKLQ